MLGQSSLYIYIIYNFYFFLDPAVKSSLSVPLQSLFIFYLNLFFSCLFEQAWLSPRKKWMLIWLLHLWTPAGSASFGSIRRKGPTRVYPMASCLATNEFNRSSYRGWILESIIPTRGIPRATSFQGKMSCTRMGQALEIPIIPRVGKVYLCSIPKINRQDRNMS